MNKQISILGTGWLGLPLSKNLVQQGYIIKGTTTSINKFEKISDEGIQPFLISLTEASPEGDINAFLKGSEILIINIPPGLRRDPDSNFIAKIQNLIPYVERSGIKKVLFISSTSVFTDSEAFPLITAETLPNAHSNAGKQLIATEQLLQNNTDFETTILRFAGLFDKRRHPATMLSKRKNIKNPLAPVNLIHRKDCIGVTKKILETDSWSHVFNASSPNHPPKAEYYSKICKALGLPIPNYNYDFPSEGKLIECKKVEEILKYKFKIVL